MPRPKSAGKGSSYYRPKKNFDKTVKEIVRKELTEELEEKQAIVEYSAVPLLSAIPSGAVINGGGNFFKLMPQISQSTAGAAGKAYNERVGNEIRLKSVNIDGFLTYDSNRAISLENSKLAVRVMILRARELSDQELLFDNMPTDTLLRLGDFSSSGLAGPTNFTGVPLDSFRDINRDTFAVRYDKVHYLNANTVLSGTTSVTTTYTPSGLKMFHHKLTFGKNGLKLKYSSGQDEQPNNFPYFMVVGVSSMAQNAVPSNNIVEATFQMTSKYTDA